MPYSSSCVVWSCCNAALNAASIPRTVSLSVSMAFRSVSAGLLKGTKQTKTTTSQGKTLKKRHHHEDARLSTSLYFHVDVLLKRMPNVVTRKQHVVILKELPTMVVPICETFQVQFLARSCAAYSHAYHVSERMIFS